MGNCQAAEAATVLIQHPGPGGKLERVYWAISASEVMASNPGHYVAIVLSRPPNSSSSSSSSSGQQPPQRHLKLLRPADTLQIGHVYRLISFEEVLKELATKKHVKLSRLLLTQQPKEAEADGRRKRKEKKTRERTERRASSTERTPTATATATVTQEPATDALQGQQQVHRADGETAAELEEEDQALLGGGAGMGVFGAEMGLSMGRRHGGHWRPVLQSIAECG